jgi:hypothetical protein
VISAEIRQALEHYLAEVRGIMAMMPDGHPPTPQARDDVRLAVQSLKERVKFDHKRRPEASIEVEIFQPAMLKLFVALQKIRVNAAPGRDWFTALYDAELELSYCLGQLE